METGCNAATVFSAVPRLRALARREVGRNYYYYYYYYCYYFYFYYYNNYY